MHNTLTLRGALVRDPRIWAHYLNQAIERYGRDADVLFACHHWPTWGTERIVDYLSEAARPLRLPARPDAAPHQPGPHRHRDRRGLRAAAGARAEAWHCRGYYGSVSHNVKAIYQRYMGWFDGNPAHLWEHPPVEAAQALRRVHGRRRRGAREGPGIASRPATSAGSPRSSTTWSSPSPTTPRRGSCRPPRSSSSATAPRTPRGATSS